MVFGQARATGTATLRRGALIDPPGIFTDNEDVRSQHGFWPEPGCFRHPVPDLKRADFEEQIEAFSKVVDIAPPPRSFEEGPPRREDFFAELDDLCRERGSAALLG